MLKRVTKDVAKRLAEVKAWYKTQKIAVQNSLDRYRGNRKTPAYPRFYEKMEKIHAKYLKDSHALRLRWARYEINDVQLQH